LARIAEALATGRSVNALAQRIAQLIEMQGPISIAQFMTMALYDPGDGYYATHDPIGESGDFITAPEISQMFGELLGLWCVQAWRDQGCPSPARLVELGPGRGTLMADALRAARIDREFLSSIEIVLVEASDRLRKQQAETLGAVVAQTKIRRVDQFDDSCTDRPLFVIANEFFDALPIQQFAFVARGWCERMVGLDKNGQLTSALSPFAALMPIASDRGLPESGAVYETSPGGEAIVEQVARAIATRGGAALIVDYGYGARAPFGETLQGVQRHEFATLLESPGETDLSAHVDFAALARAAERARAKAYGPIEQVEFLCSLGIMERAERLSRNHLQSMDRQLNRLIAADQMGTLFKALAVLPKTAPPPPGF
jgi:NADH dehydrogenase [ubiquinone] 1 alpha subcomplex assembly factor 7